MEGPPRGLGEERQGTAVGEQPDDPGRVLTEGPGARKFLMAEDVEGSESEVPSSEDEEPAVLRSSEWNLESLDR